VNWIHMDRNRVQSWPVMNDNDPLGTIKGGEFLEYVMDC
jgi:hypothetical protein